MLSQSNALLSEKLYWLPSRSISLTKREEEILFKICQGLSIQEISKELFISKCTVITHKKNLFKKFGVNNVVKLVLAAIRTKKVLI